METPMKLKAQKFKPRTASNSLENSRSEAFDSSITGGPTRGWTRYISIRFREDIHVELEVPRVPKVFHTSSWVLARALCMLQENPKTQEFYEEKGLSIIGLCTRDKDVDLDFLLSLPDQPLQFLPPKIDLVPYYKSSNEDGSQILASDIEIVSRLKITSHMEIDLVRLRTNATFYILKQFKKPTNNDSTQSASKSMILTSTDSGVDIDTNLLVKIFYEYDTATHHCYLLEFVTRGTLETLLGKVIRFKENEAKFYIAEIILALKALHASNIAFKRLKLNDILIGDDGHIKLTSFEVPFNYGVKKHSPSKKIRPTLLDLNITDEMAMAYEYDYLSVGLLTYQLLSGALLTQQNPEALVFGLRQMKRTHSAECVEFIEQISIRTVPTKLGAVGGWDEVMSHPWLKGIDFERLEAKVNNPSTDSSAATSKYQPFHMYVPDRLTCTLEYDRSPQAEAQILLTEADGEKDATIDNNSVFNVKRRHLSAKGFGSHKSELIEPSKVISDQNIVVEEDKRAENVVEENMNCDLDEIEEMTPCAIRKINDYVLVVPRMLKKATKAEAV